MTTTSRSKVLPYLQTASIMAVMLVFVFFAHLIIYLAVTVAWPITSETPTTTLKVLLTVMGIWSIAVLIIASRYNTLLTRILYRIGAVWMGFFVYFFLGSFFYGSFIGLSHLFGFPGIYMEVGQTLGVLSILTGIYGLIHARSIKTRHLKLSLPNLPAFWKGKRAVFVSDIHLGQVHGAEFSQKVVNAVNAAMPDIIFIGGDLYDGVKVDEHAIIAPFAGLKAPHGTYFVTGNHEEFADSTNFLNAIRAISIKVLLNELVNIQGLQIIGVTDHDSIHRETFRIIMGGLNINRALPSILLKHQPSYLDIPEDMGVSFQISGHTHRAQVWPFNIVPYLIYKGYSYGLKRFKSLQVYTSSGVGSWGPPVRVGGDSEIVVLELE